jgi:hypothetical protein
VRGDCRECAYCARRDEEIKHGGEAAVKRLEEVIGGMLGSDNPSQRL